MTDLGRVRVYQCVCGGLCVRPLLADPKPCDRCNSELIGTMYRIVDHGLFMEELAGWETNGGTIEGTR